jgi:plasmid stabilization system protein ParE
MARVIWSREALARLDLISLYIAEFNPVAADKMARKLLDAGNSLRHSPIAADRQARAPENSRRYHLTSFATS